MKCRVITHKSNNFEIFDGEKVFSVKARGKLKRDGEILVGDFVEIEERDGEKVILKVYDRVNSLIRPSVANVDVMVIVVACEPKPDLFLVDKMLVNCKRMGIECIICLNKTDVDDTLYEDLKSQYEGEVTAVISTSAVLMDCKRLLPYLNGKLVCFAGQSGVGKSTLSNGIYGSKMRQEGKVSEKIGRGKNTTTSASIIITSEGFWIIDTPGFSMLDVFEEDYNALAGYYDEYVALADDCKFHPCTHTTEPNCAVKKAVEEGRINRERYERYLKIFEERKQASKYAGRK